MPDAPTIQTKIADYAGEAPTDTTCASCDGTQQRNPLKRGRRPSHSQMETPLWKCIGVNTDKIVR